MQEAFAHVGGLLATGLADLTDDPAALDSRGWWAVVVTYEGKVTCIRFSRVRPAPLPRAPWRPPGEWRSSLDRDGYVAGVQAIREAIADGIVYQANLCRVLSAPLPAGADIAGLGALLARGNPAPYAMTLRAPGVQIACASPELYLSRDGRVVESRPIKGTGRTRADLLPKDRAENVMIVDLVRNDLGRVAEIGSVQVPALCATEEHPGLVHLVSTVRARLRPGAGWPELIAATFPPGSVTGAPKSSALTLLEKLEPVPRGPYCGAVGWVDADARRGALAVGIRTFWAEEGLLKFGTGAGITWGSEPVREWRETELKAARLLEVAAGEGLGQREAARP
ncbi:MULTISPECIES: chorismate-binding protein [Thermomonospora]|uniref:Chorismate binding-like protein n=1 Tax=Thermomonospora curvata (strain ATCC 19995 / DSM 43183 / JCM 3096 / KCTC 9072 / NBRC 15933 / NCIMB 10081 / Henssen B9) TaxID=471852 RepID=D1AEN7_THECD|nr:MULTISPECIES: chorismate-binding protein [Thermomonospora]ACY97612.1 Chorismate binding-like protein [Thermomonospora curvata DSM 43183]PKK14556.1 MAG: chloride transporter [Thermomonospora sp. CIF 1]